MTKKCPTCKNYQEVIIQHETKSEDTLDRLGHMDVECKMCGRRFNVWTVDSELVKKVYGNQYEIYK